MGIRYEYTVRDCEKYAKMLENMSRAEVVKEVVNDWGMTARSARTLVNKIIREQEVYCLDGVFKPKKDNKIDDEPEINFDEEVKRKAEQFDKDFEGKDLEEFITKDKYWYDPDRKKFIYFTKSRLGSDLVFPEDKVKELFHLYSNYDDNDKSINECAKRLDIPRRWVIAILNAHGYTHDSVPFTDEDIATRDYSELKDEMIARKKHSLAQDFQKEDWRQIKKQSEKYLEIKHGMLDPFQSFIDNWQPKQHRVKIDKRKPLDGDLDIVLQVSDPHFGKVASKELMYYQNEWDINESKAQIETLLENIYKRIALFSVDVRRAHLLFLGDLFDSWHGKTEKGTQIKTNPVREELFEYGYETLRYFVIGMLELFEKIDSYGVTGNHFPFGDYVFLKMLEKEFMYDERVDVDVAKARWNHFKIRNSFFIMEHGESPYVKSPIPNSETKQESYVMRLLLKNLDEMQGTKHRYFLSAHKHSFERKEYPDFEFITFSTPIKGDEYAETLNLDSRPRQNALLVDDTGVFDNLSFYLD